ncbi:hypothetical protein [Streptomyces sp. NPDC056255]|uniref:hypothetical protein n=1 Tax=Streptomyces sp. NPDC056255 TaxID=3345764 RepID=UPI0035DB3683
MPDPAEQRGRSRVVLGGGLPSPPATDRCRTRPPELRTLPGESGADAAPRQVACHLVADDGAVPDAAEAAA